jgi:hypothetical protein
MIFYLYWRWGKGLRFWQWFWGCGIRRFFRLVIALVLTGFLIGVTETALVIGTFVLGCLLMAAQVLSVIIFSKAS